MSSWVEVSNQALLLLQAKTIISLTEDSTAARLCNGKFEYARDTVLRAYPWNSSITRASLAQSSDTPEWGYDYKYTLPTDPLCLRVLEMENDNIYSWKIEGRFLVTNNTECNIKYIAQITDPNDMEVLLRDTIAARLAAEICNALAGPKMFEGIWKLYQAKLREARSVDAQEGTVESMMSDPFLDARL